MGKETETERFGVPSLQLSRCKIVPGLCALHSLLPPAGHCITARLPGSPDHTDWESYLSGTLLLRPLSHPAETAPDPLSFLPTVQPLQGQKPSA